MGTQMKWYYLMYSRLPTKGIFQGAITFYQKEQEREVFKFLNNRFFFHNSGSNTYSGNYMWCFARFATHFSLMKHVQTEFKEKFPCILNPFHANVWFLYHLKTSTKKQVFWRFQGLQKLNTGRALTTPYQ